MTGERGQLLDTLAREELGIDPQELGGSPWVAAGTSFFLFAAGALVPVLPFLFVRGLTGIALSAAFASGMLFLLGAGITVVTGRNALIAGVRQLAFGLAAATVTFGIGSLVGRVLA
jgi:VIT1/CCC1 family predicted Fe2+/Mn2+ transporter